MNAHPSTTNAPRSAWRRPLAAAAVALGLLCCHASVRAQSEASLLLSALPVASVAVVASGSAAAVATSGAAILTLGAYGAAFTVLAVEASARGTVLLLERTADGLRCSVRLADRALEGSALGVGSAVASSVVAGGVLLTAAGRALAFVPDRLGEALLYDERITR